MTMLDLASGSAKWSTEDSDLTEAVNLLAAKTDWDLAEDIAKRFLRMSALKSLAKLGVTR